MRQTNSRWYLRLGIPAAMLLLAPCTYGQNGYSYASNRTTVRGGIPGTGNQDESKQSLITVLRDLNRKKNVYFLFSEKNISEKQVNTPKDLQVSVEKILDQVLENTGLKFKKVSDDTFVILPNGSKVPQKNYVPAEIDNLGTQASRFIPITGVIKDKNGIALAGVSVSIRGSNKGTTTNTKGEFSIDASKGDVLVFSSVGYAVSSVTVGDNTSVSVELDLVDQQMSEVVVTALGVKKERKALGYSVTEVKGSELTRARETNVGNSLVGKIAGVNVNSTSGGPGSSTNITIRGVSSLSGNNQPLYVVNGVPMTNQAADGNNLQNAGGQYYNSVDYGDGIGNINPDDIETISVLKGAAASALYGSRAKGGVILITTKNGSGKGTIEFNSNLVFDDVIDLTDWQYEYGNGANGVKPSTATAAFDAGNSSWGARLDGSSVVQFDGVSRPYSAQKGNLGRFYRMGNTFTNNVAFGKAFEGGNVRFGYTNLSNSSILPNSGLDRNTFNFSTLFHINKRLTVDVRANYVTDRAKNRAILGDGAGNANFQAMFLPTSLNVETLKPGYKPNGDEILFTNNNYATNPYFATSSFINNTRRNRIIASTTLKYTFDNGLYVQGRAGQDYYYDRYTGVVPNGAGYYAQAFRNITESFTRVSEFNTDILIGKNFRVNDDFNITANVGSNLMKSRVEGTTEGGTSFAVPFVYTILNAKNKSIEYIDKRREIQSVYATLDLDYKGFLYLNASGRNDWFSTLAPSTDVDIFYPSVSGSFIFSEFVKAPFLNFGKLRVGWANVGGGADDPYQTLLNYGLFPQQLNGLPLGNITNSSIPNSKLKPLNAREIEIGTELRLFDSRVSVDVAWYSKKIENDILVAPASNTSGYTGVVLNIGELQNKGVEALVNVQVLPKTATLGWSTSINGTVNNNEVTKLTEGQSLLGIGTSRTGFGFTRHIVGEAANQVMAFDYEYDATGKVVLGANGVPVQGDLKAYGSAYHKYTAGWNNEFSFGNLNVSFLIDGKFGGKVFSATDYYGYFFGLHKNTLVGRETNFNPDPAATPTTAQAYYSQLAGNVSKMFVYDASFIKFRQLMIGYNLPPKWFGNKIQAANISLVGRNLFFIMRKTDNIDPEASYSGYAQGLELGGVPPTRSYGFNLNLKF
ncbi:MAG: SusC/RagA family TonB-linked outer membrane protein [Chitinophagaceae bacterium]|nr:MAG: SusC/RagA family TonB-linked outer membrane protein [Chitinophagaceae bacterium]